MLRGITLGFIVATMTSMLTPASAQTPTPTPTPTPTQPQSPYVLIAMVEYVWLSNGQVADQYWGVNQGGYINADGMALNAHGFRVFGNAGNPNPVANGWLADVRVQTTVLWSSDNTHTGHLSLGEGTSWGTGVYQQGGERGYPIAVSAEYQQKKLVGTEVQWVTIASAAVSISYP